MTEYILPQLDALPRPSKWFTSEYKGYGDQIHNTLLGRSAINPFEWKNLYPEYDWKVPGMVDIREALKESTRVFEELKEKGILREYEKVSDLLLPYSDLKGEEGILVNEYGAEVVTNAFIKMFEMAPYLNELLDRKIKDEEAKDGKKKKRKEKNISSVHFAEAPGNFILALNHYFNNNYPYVIWDWCANSYRELSRGYSHYLTDKYGLMRKYPDRWYYGVDGDGDITSPDNIRSFRKDFKADFATGDVKYAPPGMDYDLEEEINTPVIFGQFISSIWCLNKGGVVILKMFNFHTAAILCMMAIGSYCFEKFMVVKPLTSRDANSEIYTVGIGYRDNLTESEKSLILRYMMFIRQMNTGMDVPALFSELPSDYCDALVSVASALCERQITALDKNMLLLEEMLKRRNGLKELKEELRPQNEVKMREWIEKVGIRDMIPEAKLTRKTNNR